MTVSGERTTYELTRRLGSGGMAEVWEAVVVDGPRRGEQVALKRLKPSAALDASARAAFLDEARLASHLVHRTIVPVVDWGVVDRAEHLVYRLVPGLDARRVSKLRREAVAPLPEEIALFVVAQIADALVYAHAATDESERPLELVHRDVNPANILLGWDGYVGLTDFGIARAVGRAERTATGVVKGKVGYMAPEHAAGERVDDKADVYALGATLHALLAHHAPFRDWSDFARYDEPPIEPWIREPVAALISRAMHRDPQRRPDAAELERQARTLCEPFLPDGGPAALAAELSSLRPPDSTGALDDLLLGGSSDAGKRVRLDRD